MKPDCFPHGKLNKLFLRGCEMGLWISRGCEIKACGISSGCYFQGLSGKSNVEFPGGSVLCLRISRGVAKFCRIFSVEAFLGP